jgi:hypothetical protein
LAVETTNGEIIMSQRKRKTLDQWVEECFADALSEDKKVSMFAVVHIEGQTEREIRPIRLNQSKPHDAKDIAEKLTDAAHSHAQDLPGQQMYKMLAFYGDAKGNPSAQLPYAVRNQPGAEGGLFTEAPNAEGRMMQKMRWEEGNLALIYRRQQVMDDYSLRVMEYQGVQLAKTLHELHDAYGIVREMMIEKAGQTHEQRMKELEFERSTGERKKLMQAAPALVNQITGRKIFPQETEDTALIEMLAKHITEDQVMLIASTLPAEASGLLMARWKAALERERKEREEVTAISKEQAERADAKQLTEGDAATNGAADEEMH